MKFIICLGTIVVIAFSTFSVCFTQAPGKGTIAPHYLYPKFETGVVKMKAGPQHNVLLNYNMITEEMVFDNNGQKLALSNVDYVDTIYLNNQKFIPFERVFLECAYQGHITLLIQNKRRLIDPGTPAGYGGTSSTGAASQKSSIVGSGRIYELTIPGDLKITNDNIYWVEENNNMHKFVSEGQFLKIFPSKKDSLKKFIKTQKIDFRQKEDLVKLIQYLNEI